MILILGMMVRFIAIDMVLKKEFSLTEKFFMTVMMPKGVAVAVVALSLAVLDFTTGFQSMLFITVQIILFTMLISLFFSTIVTHFSSKLLDRPKIKNTPKKINLKPSKTNKSNTLKKPLTKKSKSTIKNSKNKK